MRSQIIERRCQWAACASEASKHLTYTELGEVTEMDHRGATMSIPILHVDLCDQHLPEARTRVGGHVRELNEECSPECPQYER